MIQDFADFDLIPQTPTQKMPKAPFASLKLPKAILSTDPANSQQPTVLYSSFNKSCQLSNSIYFLITFFFYPQKIAGFAYMREYRLFL